MSDITIYGFPPSSYTWSARIAAAEKGISHDLESPDFGSDDLLALHPFGKIPAMKHGDVVLYETSAISHYIDLAFNGPALQPSDPAGIAQMEQWISNIIDYYYEWCIKRIVIQRIVVPVRGGETDEEMVADAAPHAKHVLEVANRRLGESDYLAGPEASIADFMMTPIAIYMSKTPEGEEILNGTPALNDWIGRMSSRPSFEATVPPPPGS